jgi:predicted negative regulator of RcsB-dependent stress response
MEGRTQDMEGLVDRLTAKDKKRRRYALLYLGLPVLAGLALTFLTGRQTTELRTLGDSTSTLQTQLVQSREASSRLPAALDLAHKGNYSAALEQLDTAIALDSLNAVAHKLKGKMLLVKRDFVKAAESFKRAVQVDSIQVKARRDLQLKRPR